MDNKIKQLKKRPKNILQVIVKQQDGEAEKDQKIHVLEGKIIRNKPLFFLYQTTAYCVTKRTH